jgi:hypothetical protein
MAKIKDYLLEQQQERNEEIDREFQEHDCHASPEDSCEVCEKFRQLTQGE